jgi:hypothetical protein
MKLRPHQHFNPTRKFYVDRSDSTPVTSEHFFRQLEERRLLWADRKPMPTPDQESCLLHLRDQFSIVPFPTPSTKELTAFVTHPDFPVESVAKLLALFHLY